MSSQARNYLEDQLLGFVQVPLSSLVGKGKHTQEFALSSTELFHSHAGTMKLTFMYHEHKRSSMGSQILNGRMSSSDGLGAYLQPEGTDDGSMASGISALSSNSCQNGKLSVSDYGNVEFQDMQAIAEDQQLVCNYLSAAANKVECKDVAATVENGMITGPPFLQMGSLNVDLYCDRAGEEQCRGTSSMTDDCQLFSYSRTPISNAENNLTIISDISEMKTSARSEMEVNSSPSSANYPTSSSSQTASGASSCQDFFTRFSAPSTSSMQMESSTRDIGRIVKEIDVLRGNVRLPLVNMSTESEPKVVQQEIVDMYMKSMQQFTEALAKMQLPMDMDIKEATPTKNSSSERDSDETGKKNSQRVFYGSRAFF
ncbi:hypothetical protein O6H91_12G036000 [Diphasiastrum complanatum]|nr:hypothetical protein O6H91_Y386000 [Diphasiastrum complanatum]KAJ7535486.1 hypothetical protein O6H91_12G036000 [Diphasiastrum complanatum]